MPKEENLQRATLKWIQLIDEEINGVSGPVKYHAGISANEVATKYGCPQDALRHYIKVELEKEESCRTLPFTLLMLFSYTAMTISHDPVVPVNAVEEAVVFDVEENANFAFTNGYFGHKGIYDANSKADIWSWMIQGLAPLIFQQSRGFSEGSNVDVSPLKEVAALPGTPRHERGLLLGFNQIIGGLRVNQERGKMTDCQTFQQLRSMYNRQCSDRFGGSGYEMYPEMATAMMELDPQREFWLWTHDDLGDILETLRTKERERWFDDNTTKVQILIPIYNAQYGVYSIIYVHFYMSHGGHIWKRVIPFSTYSQFFYGTMNYVYDLVWGLGILYIFFLESYKVITTLNSRAAEIAGRWYILRTEYISPWNIIDWANVAFGVWIIVSFSWRLWATTRLNGQMRGLGVFNDGGSEDAYRKLAQEAVDNLEKEVATVSTFRLLQSSYPMLIVLRLFKVFAHQPRLSIVSRTLSSSWSDLLHFAFVFMSVLLTFTASGMILFGREVEEFTRPMRAANTAFRIMMGDFDWDTLVTVGRVETGLWFMGFMLFIVMLLLNMLLAIVMDAYSEQKTIVGDAATLYAELILLWCRWRDQRRGIRLKLKDVYGGFRIILATNRSWHVYRGMAEVHQLDYMAEESHHTSHDRGRNHRKAHAMKHVHTGKQIVGKGMIKEDSVVRQNTQERLPSAKDSAVEEFHLITVEILCAACRYLREPQATELLEEAIQLYHHDKKETTNVEEMTRIIRRVDDGTKEIRQILLDERPVLAKGQAPQDESAVWYHVVTEFEDEFWNCRKDLRKARTPIGEQFPDKIPRQGRAIALGKDVGKSLDYRGTMVMRPLETIEDVSDFGIKCVLNDLGEVLHACRERGITTEKDDLRTKALGKAVRIVEIDSEDFTVLCRIPAIGDVWFALESLAQLRATRPQDMEHHYYGQYGHHLSLKEATITTIDQTGVGVTQFAVEEQFSTNHAEVLRKIHDLQSELRVSRQTVVDAQEALEELDNQLDEERQTRLKLAQKLESLRKKVAARSREQNHLVETFHHQDERANIVGKSRDEYLELVQSLFAKKHAMKDRLDDHGHNRSGGHKHSGGRERRERRSTSGRRRESRSRTDRA